MQYVPVAYNTGYEFRSGFTSGKLRFRNQDRETPKAPMTRAHRRDISMGNFHVNKLCQEAHVFGRSRKKCGPLAESSTLEKHWKKDIATPLKGSPKGDPSRLGAKEKKHTSQNAHTIEKN